MKNSGKLAIGIAIGMAIGSAIAYFSDRENRKCFVDNVTEATDKARDSVVEGYYEAKEKYYKYRDMLKKQAGDFVEEAGDFVEEAVDKTKGMLGKGAEK